MTTPLRSRSARPLLLALAALMLVTASCGSALTEVGAIEARELAPDEVVAEEAAGNGALAPANPWAIGWRVTGEPRSSIEGTITYISGTDELDQSANQILPLDGVAWTLQSTTIEGLRVAVRPVGSDPIVVEVFIGRAADPSDPFSGVEIREVLQTETITEADTIILEGTIGE